MESKGVFSSWSVSDFKATFNAIWQECKRLGRFIIEVRPLDEAKEISLQQMKYVHCEAGPITLFANYQGIDVKAAELDLKRKCGRHIFVTIVTLRNIHKLTHGDFRYECIRSMCNKLCYPHQAMKVHDKYICPTCGHPSLQLIHIRSKTELSVKKCNEWINSMIGFCQDLGINCQPPDPNWRENKHG